MRSIKSFDDANAALKRYIPTPRNFEGAKFSKEDMVRLMDFLGNPQEDYKVVHVAGTSGKTSTCYYTSSLLSRTGAKVGLTVSPHVDSISERVQINLKPLDENYYCKKLGEFLGLVDRSGLTPTYFCVLMAFAFWMFREENVDYAVVEVGMGGTADASNVIKNPEKICIITDIDYDHTEFLGDTLAKIAEQKAGIIHPGNHVFSYRQDDEIDEVLKNKSEKTGAELDYASEANSGYKPDFLPGFQQRNWNLAKTAVQYLVGRDRLDKLLREQLISSAKVYIPARMETVKINGKILIMDGAHNAQKIETLLKSIVNAYPGEQICSLFSSVKSNSDRSEGSAETLAKYASHIIITSFSGEQDTPKFSEDSAAIVSFLEKYEFRDYEVLENPEEGLKRLFIRPEKVLLVTGSFYLLNHIRPLILDN